jgi:hypothetical protein
VEYIPSEKRLLLLILAIGLIIILTVSIYPPLALDEAAAKSVEVLGW